MGMRWIAIVIVVVCSIAACRETVSSTPDPAPSPPITTTTDAAPMTDAAPVAASSSTTSCDRDDDCVVTNNAGCCACPQCQIAAPHALTRAQEKLEEDKCAVVDCDFGPCNVGGMCKPGEPAAHFAARCVDHACTMARVAPP